jgi:hypothetical protein
MQFKVCLLAAGINETLSFAKDFNSALVPIGYKSGLSRIIEKFTKDTEIVIAIGYKGELIREFTMITHPDSNITFVDVGNFNGAGAGSGKSLLSCKEYLQCPFIFTSANTLIHDEVPAPSKNWIGVASVMNSEKYLVAEIDGGLVRELYDKIPTDLLIRKSRNYRDILDNGFIGMAGVYDFQAFWSGLESDERLVQGKRTVTSGLRLLMKRQLHPVRLNWVDTSTEVGHIYAERFFSNNETIIKPQEFLYFENGKVVKYFANSDIVKKRARRAEILDDVVPKLTFSGENFYAYEFIDALTLSQISDKLVFEAFLSFCERTVWRKVALTPETQDEFFRQCKVFYENKTRSRVNKAFSELGIVDDEEIINSVRVPKISVLLEQVDWEWLSKGTAVLFHGDLQPENILFGSCGFKLIDWRHEFGNIVEYGDIYYDFAKLHHALIITHEVIRKKEFSIDVSGNVIMYNFMIKHNLLNFLDMFETFLENNGFDLKKVRVLSALTYLNIAPLHHHPYNLFLFYYGKDRLYNVLKDYNG